MLLRFCILRPDPDSHSRQGVFQAAFALRDNNELENYEEEWLERELSWLTLHLPSPKCLREYGNERAICWFKSAAHKPIARVRGIVELLKSHGLHVSMLTTADPGSVIYQDNWQVVAKPRRKPAPSQFQARRCRHW